MQCVLNFCLSRDLSDVTRSPRANSWGKGKKKNRNSSLVPVPVAEASLLGPDEDSCFREGAIRRLVLHNFL